MGKLPQNTTHEETLWQQRKEKKEANFLNQCCNDFVQKQEQIVSLFFLPFSVPQKNFSKKTNTFRHFFLHVYSFV